MTAVLDLPAPRTFGPFLVVDLQNGVSLDYYEVERDLEVLHYAFLVTEPEFDRILERIRARSLPYWADPARTQPGEINHHFGGRGMYFTDPDGHLLEVITQPYGMDFPS